jgi:septum formation protein
MPAGAAVGVLARRKGEAVATRLRAAGDGAAVVVACDSLLEFDDQAWGKAASAEQVMARWRRMRGGRGRLHTGHYVVDLASGEVAEETDSALIRFGSPSDDDLAAYAATGESRSVAGPFTLEGRSAPWIDGIDGNYGTVTGISLAVLDRLLGRLGMGITGLWRPDRQ